MTKTPAIRAALLGASLVALAGCVQSSGGGFDIDLRGGAFDTTDAAARATASRPQPDARGVISYPTYQVVVARDGDTVGSIATRLGLNPTDLARNNALSPETRMGRGEILVLPGGAQIAAAPAAGGISGGPIDVTTLASSAINRAPATAPAAGAPTVKPGGVEPVRHKVVRGETAYTIARAYNVTPKALADWNGLGPDLAVREGQTLMIPVSLASAQAPADAPVTLPGEGSPTPTPPSAAKPLPANDTTAAAAPTAKPPAPDMSAQTTATSQLAMPVQGKIIRPYVKKQNDGIDIAAAAGTAVTAAADGTVAAITKDTKQVPIIVVRHSGNLLTVYANIDGITVAKGDVVKRGQTIARVRASDPAFLHFEVREGLESVDPVKYLQ